MEPPKVFISYSWTSPNHSEWVLALAERLVADGVDVTIDKWNLKEGHDMFSYMESMVASPQIVKVLIILDKRYAEKADQRSGGVGTETQIISPEIYANVSQEKFIPILAEMDVDGNGFIPSFLRGRIYINLSVQDQFEVNYEKLLRNIFKRPEFSKPKLGSPPSYLFDETPMNYKTSLIIRNIDKTLTNNPKRINSMLHDFLDEFYQNLKGFTISFSHDDAIGRGKEICDNIISYTTLRDDFIIFFDRLSRSKDEFEMDIDIIIRFLEKLPLLTNPQDLKTTWSEDEFDNFRFFIHELFLYIIGVNLRNENFEFVSELLYSGYIYKDKYDLTMTPKTYEIFGYRITSINRYYNQTYSQNFHSPMADLMIKRIPDFLTKDNLIDSDLICHYVGLFNNSRWFPVTYVYRQRGGLEIFKRLISLRHFEKVKCLFDTKTVQDFKDKLSALELRLKDSTGVRFPEAFENVTPLSQIIDKEKMATMR